MSLPKKTSNLKWKPKVRGRARSGYSSCTFVQLFVALKPPLHSSWLGVPSCYIENYKLHFPEYCFNNIGLKELHALVNQATDLYISQRESMSKPYHHDLKAVSLNNGLDSAMWRNNHMVAEKLVWPQEQQSFSTH